MKALPTLYRVSVTYDVLVLADVPKKAVHFAKTHQLDTLDDQRESFRAHAEEVTPESLSPDERTSLPWEFGTNPEGHTVGWWCDTLQAEKDRVSAERQPHLPGILP